MRLIVYPYRMSSRSSRVLARSFDRGLRVYPYRNYRPRRGHFIVNWGSGLRPRWLDRCESLGMKIKNRPPAVCIAAHKLAAFVDLSRAGLNVPEWTETWSTAALWAADEYVVFCRQYTQSGGGNGITVARCPDEMVHARFYTKHVPTSTEYRVHVWDGKVIDITEKRRRNDAEANPYIRNHNHGWVFCRDDIALPYNDEELCLPLEDAARAVRALGLDFGAVDVGWNDRLGVVTIFEVNTAPGLRGTTLERYVAAITQSMEEADGI